MDKVYNKVPLSFDHQLALLKDRGLSFNESDETIAISHLREISYYRFSAYFLPYQTEKDKFDPSINFNQIIKTYTFDRELRLLVFDCIERIEVAIRIEQIQTTPCKLR